MFNLLGMFRRLKRAAKFGVDLSKETRLEVRDKHGSKVPLWIFMKEVFNKGVQKGMEDGTEYYKSKDKKD